MRFIILFIKKYREVDRIIKEFYYKDELNDDFAGVNRNAIEIGKNFKYTNRNPLWHLASFFVYDIVMRPIAFLYCKFKFSLKLVGKEKLKGYKNRGCFFYGNHTQIPGDAYIPNIFCFPKKPYFIVHPDNVSAKGTKNIMLMLGAIPLPTNLAGYKNFLSSISFHHKKGNGIVIFPEAHIWPYYTGIRPFKSTSFKYPLQYNSPVFCFTSTYQKRKYRKIPEITVYIDGPFFCDNTACQKEACEKLRNQVYDTMCSRAINSNYEYIKYIKADDND